MDLSYYRLADCRLFRTPPVDFSRVKEEIERMLVTAWQSGKPAGSAIEEIAGNAQIVGGLASQIERSLLYQRSHAVDILAREGEERKRQYEAERHTRLGEIERTLGADAAEKERAAAEAAGKYDQVQGSYNAAQARLEELRANVKERLKAIGGRAGYAELSRINRELVGEAGAALPSIAYRPMPPRPRPRKPYAGSEEAAEAAAQQEEGVAGEQAGAEAQQPGAEESPESLEEVIAGIEGSQKKNVVHRFLEKAWAILNYKIW